MAGKATGRGNANGPPVTIIIRRDEGEEPPHHGGAWKVAYADFVTAMMAFFLLMWLLNATTEDQRKGLADYFAPTNLFGRSASGSGQPFGGQTPNDTGTSISTSGSPQVRPEPQPQSHNIDDEDPPQHWKAAPRRLAIVEDDASGSGPPINQDASGQQNDGTAAQDGKGPQALTAGGDYAAAALLRTPGAESPQALAAAAVSRMRNAAKADAERESRTLEQAGAQLLDAIRRDPTLGEAAGQLTIETIPQGLRIQVVDAERRPMFALGGSTPTRQVRDLMRKVAPVLAALPNEISIAGHTDALTYRSQEKGNWELSTERANATRKVLMESGLGEDRIRSVTGNADRDLLMPSDPLNAVNRRISIIVLRHAGTDQPGGTTP